MSRKGHLKTNDHPLPKFERFMREMKDFFNVEHHTFLFTRLLTCQFHAACDARKEVRKGSLPSLKFSRKRNGSAIRFARSTGEHAEVTFVRHRGNERRIQICYNFPYFVHPDLQNLITTFLRNQEKLFDFVQGCKTQGVQGRISTSIFPPSFDQELELNLQLQRGQKLLNI